MTQLKSNCKFRISLSTEQINYILSLDDCPADLRKQLELALFKAGNGYIKPAFELKPREQKDLTLDQRYKMALTYLSRDAEIPPELLHAYTEYRYLNDMMDTEESAAYEANEGF